MNPLPDQTNLARTSWAEQIKVVGAVVGILSALAAVATFIGFKPERKKMLEWEYISKSSLVNQDAPAADKIQILYEGRQIRQLTVITARLTNTGSVPIENADVKDGVYPNVTFTERVIRADLKDPNRRGIKAEAVFDEHNVQVKHGLLNVGDSVPIQILLEGDPGEISKFPEVLFRIAGIDEPLTRYPSARQSRVGIAYFRFGRTVEFTVLIIASLIPLAFGFLCGLGLMDLRDSISPERKLLKFAKNPSLVTAAEGDSLPEKLARSVYGALPPPIDKKARDFAQNITQDPNESVETYVRRAVVLVKKEVKLRGIIPRWRLLDKPAATMIVAVSSLGICVSLVLIACWHRIIVDY